MQVTHRTTIVSKCPRGCSDVYDAEFRTADLVMVEDIAKCIERATESALTQEQLTQALANDTQCRVVTTGVHSTSTGPFDTRVEAEPQ